MAMLTADELKAKYAPTAIQIDGQLLNAFGYHKEASGVFLVGEPEEATDGGYGRSSLTRLGLGGERGETPAEVAKWASDLFQCPIL